MQMGGDGNMFDNRTFAKMFNDKKLRNQNVRSTQQHPSTCAIRRTNGARCRTSYKIACEFFHDRYVGSIPGPDTYFGTSTNERERTQRRLSGFYQIQEF